MKKNLLPLAAIAALLFFLLKGKSKGGTPSGGAQANYGTPFSGPNNGSRTSAQGALQAKAQSNQNPWLAALNSLLGAKGTGSKGKPSTASPKFPPIQRQSGGPSKPRTSSGPKNGGKAEDPFAWMDNTRFNPDGSIWSKEDTSSPINDWNGPAGIGASEGGGDMGGDAWRSPISEGGSDSSFWNDNADFWDGGNSTGNNSNDSSNLDANFDLGGYDNWGDGGGSLDSGGWGGGDSFDFNDTGGSGGGGGGSGFGEEEVYFT